MRRHCSSKDLKRVMEARETGRATKLFIARNKKSQMR
jgi:hypothetical protein